MNKPAVWGPPDVKIENPQSLIAVAEKIGIRNGVYFILGEFSDGITGHATLWVASNRDVIGGHNYIDGNGGTVYFWELC